ncbi:major capsid protein [Burkholderia anthina]|uniref:major capsid protein n=1 Tax=Burkholderia anthina TaxID=179879 RepID=UPI001ABA7892|nr:major capsid protein [Burkholderia anthina]
MNPGQARVIDPILTAVAQGYTNSDFVGRLLFPVVPVGARAGKIIRFGKQDFLLYNTRRAPGQNTKRVQFGYADTDFALADHSLEGAVPIENQQEAQAVPGIDLGQGAVRSVQNIMALGVEYEQATLARDPAQYANSNKTVVAAADRWTNPDSDPFEVVADAREAIRKGIGKRPNAAVIGPSVYAALQRHPKVIDRMKYTGRDVPTVEILAALFELPQLAMGDAVYSTDGNSLGDVWGDDMVLGYTVQGSMQDRGSPAYGYTYQLDGHPIVEQPYYENNTKTWYYPVTDARKPYIAGASAGYLIKGAGTAAA